MERIDALAKARDFAASGKYGEAWEICSKYLSLNPEDSLALVVTTYLHRKWRNIPMSYILAKRTCEVAPREPAAWLNLSQACKDLHRHREGISACNKGLAIAKRDEDIAALYQNLSAIYIDEGRFAEAEEAIAKVRKYDPDGESAISNLGFCQLARHDWAIGWKNYHQCLGTEDRLRQVFSEPHEPEWDGAPGQTVVLYGEQGIGDEICFASMVPDAIERAGKVILSVDKRLESLFRRSFPQAKVYGTRTATAADGVKWDVDDSKVDASLAMAQCGEFFRLSDADFPAEPYLKSDPDRVTMWKALFAAKRKPCIGLAWIGGVWLTGKKFRTLSLEQMLPVMQAVDAHFVVLQYKDCADEVKAFRAKHPEIDLGYYPHATLAQDYDDTAALVAALDRVISLPTAVVHLAGALGVPCTAMKAPHSCWKFANGLAFHPGVELIEHQGSWDQTILETSRRMKRHFRKLEAVACSA